MANVACQNLQSPAHGVRTLYRTTNELGHSADPALELGRGQKLQQS